MKNLWRTSAEPLRVVLAPSPSLSVLFSDAASAIETTTLNHSFMPLWLSGGKIHHFWIESQGEGTTPFLVQAVAASRLRRSLHACIVAGFSGQTVYEERAQLSSSRHGARMTWETGGTGDQEDISPSFEFAQVGWMTLYFYLVFTFERTEEANCLSRWAFEHKLTISGVRGLSGHGNKYTNARV